MVVGGKEPIWTADPPTAWPKPPAEMTLTLLDEIESCPRRWGLSAADYPKLWPGRGYPPRVHLGAIRGTVVHMALEIIVKALVRAHCPSAHDAAAFRVMRDLGGYTKVIDGCIDQVLHRLTSSPRAWHLLEYAARSLRSWLPEARTEIQTVLSRIRLPLAPSAPPVGDRFRPHCLPREGVFPEVDLCAEKMGWRGKADLLVLSHDSCQITDFKTGSRDAKHWFQIRVYALLWSRDARNPTGRRADRLVLEYGDGKVEVPAPTEPDLRNLEEELMARAAAAREAASAVPPEAKPSPQTCFYCDVRHMCTNYWNSETQRLLGCPPGSRAFADLEVQIADRHGPTSWDAVVLCCPVAKRGQSLLLRTDEGRHVLAPGQVVRLLAVHIAEDSRQGFGPIAIGTTGVTSEVFLRS